METTNVRHFRLDHSLWMENVTYNLTEDDITLLDTKIDISKPDYDKELLKSKMTLQIAIENSSNTYVTKANSKVLTDICKEFIKTNNIDSRYIKTVAITVSDLIVEGIIICVDNVQSNRYILYSELEEPISLDTEDPIEEVKERVPVRIKPSKELQLLMDSIVYDETTATKVDELGNVIVDTPTPEPTPDNTTNETTT